MNAILEALRAELLAQLARLRMVPDGKRLARNVDAAVDSLARDDLAGAARELAAAHLVLGQLLGRQRGLDESRAAKAAQGGQGRDLERAAAYARAVLDCESATVKESARLMGKDEKGGDRNRGEKTTDEISRIRNAIGWQRGDGEWAYCPQRDLFYRMARGSSPDAEALQHAFRLIDAGWPIEWVGDGQVTFHTADRKHIAADPLPVDSEALKEARRRRMYGVPPEGT
jgi:hypothetical protein